ncbi:helix-turn-helix domain-containing protein [Cellulomonas biazotea]|uniref:HTH cro/C1-type domain-containing protein n=1 Tax=Cellulomonas biazotea TaxID=1709 RepID=A0A402DTK6_9CELL|nr:helix-turn-helix domain-containing protein [Cellulomonas biazotea]GCE77396.1 hypothetical protein CBZ_24520 [Cellulomonas biazotea]
MRASTSTGEIGAQLRAARRGQGLTQAEVAVAAHVSRAFVVDLEGGKRPGAELGRVLAVARVLGLGVALVPEQVPTFEDALNDVLGARR